MRALIQSHKFSIANFSYRLETEGRVLRHSMTLQTTDRAAASRLANDPQGKFDRARVQALAHGRLSAA